ncbi:sulfate reduction electron transfer complex DsrMKJOP subunit DsrP [Desulfosarcina ovata]|uniref:Menaquinol oxidoreductase n=1 Tax=Desulfosarcina ovata subsp. ovata TaxID=2752305 RepID=A0A5K8AFC7_9BACT|nr:NrfD/PsrC family molybdoenzyme membrane anchor subunit [Desulfosarcina ovata]BBO90620.1 menaquinol oxidoreductase [Desulfosarcina ovata subsp. ovata]
MLEQTLTGGRRYWQWLGFLGVVILTGTGFYLWQLDFGLGLTGLSRDVTWGFYVAQLTFLVGVAASAVMLVLPYYLHDYKAFGRITIIGEFLAAATICMCLLFLFVDLGQPMRALNVFLYPTPGSVIFWDATVLSGYLLLNIIIGWNVLEAERNGVASPAWLKPLIIVSIPWAFAIHTVTAFLYCGLPGRGLWLTAILAPRFLASAFASGPALLILLCLFLKTATGFDAGRQAIATLAKIVTYGLLANLFFLMCEVFVVFYSRIPAHMDHFLYLYIGLEGKSGLVPWMQASLVLMVTAAVLLLIPATRNHFRILAVACGMVFVGTWIDKGIGLIAGGFIPSPLHEITEYVPTGPELIISLGVYGIGSLLLTLLLKIVIGVKAETTGIPLRNSLFRSSGPV